MGDMYTNIEKNSSQLIGDLLNYHNSNLFSIGNFYVDPSHIKIHSYNRTQLYSL